VTRYRPDLALPPLRVVVNANHPVEMSWFLALITELLLEDDHV
jgi:hypothetical protein